ncbi:hypothetical protein ACRAWD_10480 [Caulobacter segnis]
MVIKDGIVTSFDMNNPDPEMRLNPEAAEPDLVPGRGNQPLWRQCGVERHRQSNP